METNSTDGYTCRCRDGFVDKSPDKMRKPGRICEDMVGFVCLFLFFISKCTLKINECLDRSLNDCHENAICEDLVEGFTCRCPSNAIDQSPDKQRRPGRNCFTPTNECANPALNNCSRFAECKDKPIGYECTCRENYHDMNPKQPGTSCQLGKYLQYLCFIYLINNLFFIQ
jgi:hypothetical protein